MTDPPCQAERWPSRTLGIVGVIALGVAVRGAYIFAGAGADWSLPPGDPDGYARIAHELVVDGRYARDDSGATAFRLPGYVLAIAPFCREYPPNPLPIFVLQFVASAVAIWATWLLAERLGAGAWSLLAAGVVAVDPDLVHHSSLVMSETLFTMFFCLALAFFVGADSLSRWSVVLAGIFVGLAALTRPVMWPAWLCVGVASGCGGRTRMWLLATAAAVLIYAPWPIRNWITMGSPILTTTHGGYTLWLGMNPVYYREVVAGPHAIWPEESFQEWTRENADETRGKDEIEADRHFGAKAWSWMRSNPVCAARSTIHHIASFWTPMPRVGANWQRRVVASFYIGLYLAAGVGLVHGRGWRWPRSLVLANLVAFTLVHAVYWSNVRMRAPLAPALGVLASFSGQWGGRSRRPVET